MSTLVNPTKEQVEKFCDMVKKELLAAVDRHSTIELSHKQETRDVFSMEYGQCPIDALYVGAVFGAKFRERGY